MSAPRGLTTTLVDDLPRPQSRQKRPRVSNGDRDWGRDRRRTFRACESCRRQKERCEGGIPCGRCIRLRRPCLAPMTTVSVEDDQSVPQLDQEQNERLKLMDRMLRHFIGHVPSDINELRRVAESLDADRAKLPTSIINDASYDSDDSAIADESFMFKEISGNVTHYSGELSHWNFSKRVQREINSLGPESDQSETSNVKEYYRAKHLQSSGATALTVALWFPPQPVAEFLVETFFKYGQTNYFYVEKGWVMEKLESIYKPTSNGSSDDSPTWCILLTLLAIGTQFVDLDSTRNHEQSISRPTSHDAAVEDDVGITLYKLAVKLIPDVLAIASLESVQAFLLLGVYTLPMDTSGLSYTYLGTAIKMAIQNGMHRKYSGVSLDEHAVEVRKRLWWTVYTLEKRICILHGRPLSISSSDIDVELPTDFPDFQPSNFENLRAIIMLTPYLEAVATTIIRLRNSSKALHSDRLDELLRHSESLKIWWSSPPEEVYCRDLDPQNFMFRANVHLNLAFYLTQVFLGRPFLFTYAKSSSSPGGSAKSKASMARYTLAVDCIEAAHQILDLCQLLNDHGGLARSSYIEFSSCRTALLVLLAHSLNENTKRLRNCLTNGMNLMRIMTRGVDSTKHEFSIIELLERVISRLKAHSESGTTGHLNERRAGYEQFKNWAQLWTQTYPQAQTSGLIETNQQHHPPSSSKPAANGADMSGIIWSPSTETTTVSNFALEPFFAYSQPMGESEVGQSSKNIYQQSTPNLNFENLEPGWMAYPILQ